MNKLLIRLMGLACVVVMLLGLLFGCAPAAPTQPGASQPAGSAAATAAAPAPTKAGEVFYWRCQSTSSAGDALYWSQQKMCDEIAQASGGRLNWKLFPAGAIVARLECFDAVALGAVECTPGYSENDSGGRDMKFELTSIPGGMSAFCQWLWENYETKDDPVPPGEKLFQGLYEKYGGIKVFNTGVSSPEAEFLANKKIMKPADYKGLTFRGAGWELEVISQPEFGAKPVFIASTDIYSSMQTGVIDAFESSNPYANYVSGYHDITKYWGFPGMHNLSQTSHMMINKDAWKSLPPDLQKIVELAANQMESRNLSFAYTESAKILPVLAKKGIEFIYEDKDIQLMWRNMMLKSAQERAKKDPAFLTELNKCLEFQYLIDAYTDLQTPVYDSTYPGKKENIPGFIWK